MDRKALRTDQKVRKDPAKRPPVAIDDVNYVERVWIDMFRLRTSQLEGSVPEYDGHLVEDWEHAWETTGGLKSFDDRGHLALIMRNL